uniref:Ig-like domain-containing protein n=1 Tax=Cyclopterus lumpus TaxID=8103 RepID=A0A8C2ZL70_CYCLU
RMFLNNLDPCFFPLFPITGESVKRLQSCYSEFCITLIEGEITAEAGLCVVIPCFFTTGNGFTPQYVVWYKCEPPKGRCGDADVIFHTNENNNNKVQAEFLGRVSLLEPDVSQKNCSIIINELTESDSGKYQVRVNSVNYWGQERSTFSTRATVSVKAACMGMNYNTMSGSRSSLLCEGETLNLTCSVESFPPSLITNRQNNTELFMQRESETGTLSISNVTTDNSGKYICRNILQTIYDCNHKISSICLQPLCRIVTGNILSIICFTDVKKPVITGRTTVEEGDALSLTCSVESFPPSHITWTVLGSNKKLYNGPEKDTGSATLVLPNVTTEVSGQYICTAQHLDKTVATYADVTVTCK